MLQLRRWWCPFLLLLALAACSQDAPSGSGAPRVRLGFVTNCAVEFWAIAEAGVRDAAAANDVDVRVYMPPTGVVGEQKAALEGMIAAGVQGIAVSPIKPDDMADLLNDIASRCVLVTHDSDAPNTQRRCFIGVDNYVAGRLCGELIEEAAPDGGPVVLLVGSVDQDNARRRRQGIIDHLLQRAPDPDRFDPVDAVLKNDKWEIRATFTTQFLASKAKAVAEDVLSRWDDVRVLVGLFAYEPPVILDAVRTAGRLDRIAVVGFDEDAATLQGIADGEIYGTVVQNPYEYGRQSIELLARLVREPDEAKRAAMLPENRWIVVPARQIRRADVAAFRRDLDQKLGR